MPSRVEIDLPPAGDALLLSDLEPFVEHARHAGAVADTTVIMENSYVYGPDGRQERISESEFEDLRNSLRSMLTADWPAYIQELERAGKIRPAP